MEYEVHRLAGGKSTNQTVDREHLPGVYAELREDDSSTVVWESGDMMRSIIVHVARARSVITLVVQDSFYYLTVSDDDSPVFVQGLGATVPRKTMAPRELGLTVLLRADDLPGLCRDYLWWEWSAP